MKNSGGSEDNPTGLNEAALTIAVYFKFALADEEEFGVGVAMRLVRHLTGRQGGFVDFDELPGGESAVDDGAAGSSVG